MFLLPESSNNETVLQRLSEEGMDEVKSINHSGLAEMIAMSFAVLEGQLPFQSVSSLAKKTASLRVAHYPNRANI